MKKGKELFEKIKDRIEYKKTEFEIARRGNPCIYNHKLNKEKEKSFLKIFQKDFIMLHKKYFPYPSKISKIINFPRRVLGFIKRRIFKILKGV